MGKNFFKIGFPETFPKSPRSLIKLLLPLGLVHTHFVVTRCPVHQASVNEYFPVDFLKLNKVLMYKNP